MSAALITALLDYALFLAKALTLFGVLALLILVAVRGRRRGGEGSLGHHQESEHLEILDLNQRFDDLARAVKESSLPKRAFAAFEKRERRDRRARDKALAKADAEPRPRLFVIDFCGDLRASEVSALRELVTTIVLEHRPGDAVLVRLENAGGTVHEHGLAASQLARLRAHGLHLTVAVDKIAASGGYLMACVANRITAAPFAVIGSIGVLAELPNFHRLMERNGIDFELHTAGEYKRTLTLFGENTEAARDKLRQQLDETHALFKSFVAQHRPALDLGAVATGEYWHGQQALELGLVDAIQTSDDLLLAARESTDLWQLKYSARKRPIDRLLNAIGGRIERAIAAIVGRLAGP